MSRVGMREIVELIRNSKNDEQLWFNQDLQNYIEDLDKVGGKILRQVPEDQVYASVTLLQALVSADLINDGEMKLAYMCMADPEVFSGMMTIALKMSVGIAALEEWR